MTTPTIAQHRAELHDAFFEDRDQELLDFQQFEKETIEKDELDKLRTRADINDPEVLEALKQVGVTYESMTAFMLVPLLRLAWADSKMQSGEFESILKASTEDGIAYGTPAYWLLSRWLEERPTEKMLDAWNRYARALARELDEKSLDAFRQATLGRARRVAEASGGMLGLGDRISDNERRVLKDLAYALTKPSNP